VNFIRNPSTSTILFRTSRSVEAGEELCIYYSPDETMLWSTPAYSTHMNGDASLSEDEEEMIFPELGPEDLTRPPKQERAGQGKRKTKYFKKRIPSNQEKPNDEAVILSPQPVAFTGSIVPDLQDYPRPDVPAPLHSGKNKVLRHEHVGPVVLTPDLDWREEKWFDGEKEREGSSSSNDSWGEVVRIKGPAERMGEDAGADEMREHCV